jgi:MYXO-CTERM domain-containing protein
MHAVNGCGAEPAGWPKFTNGWLISSAAVGDVMGDGSLDVVTATREGFLYAWRTKGSASGVIQWESFHHDNQNTGSYAHTLDQGVYKGAGKLDCPAPTTNTPTTLTATGCSCDTVGVPSGNRWGALSLVGFGLLLRRRKSALRALR